MALALGTAVYATTYLPGSTINGSLEQRVGNRPKNVSSMVMHGTGTASKRVAEDSTSASLRRVVEKANLLWWTPLVGTSVEEFWSNMPDVAQAIESAEEQQVGRIAPPPTSVVASASVPLQDVVESAVKPSRKAAVSFTPEKARALRKSLRDSKTWHDGWYHSAIASRLAEESH